MVAASGVEVVMMDRHEEVEAVMVVITGVRNIL